MISLPLDFATTDPGARWNGTGEPPDCYFFMISSEDFESELKPVSDAEDDRMASLLLWVYNYFVHKVPGDTVVCREEAVYFVGKATVEHEPEWLARIECFSVWDRQNVTVTFKLTGPQ